MKQLHLVTRRSAPALVAHDGGLAIRTNITRSPTIVIMDIDDEEAANWDAEMMRRSR